MFDLAEVFSKQAELINHDGVYQNEFETIKQMHTLPAYKQLQFNSLTQQLLDNLEQPRDEKACAERSRCLREEGNRFYKTKASKKGAELADCLLEACRLYTQAILEAEQAHEELCLGYANRGMALQDFGYYAQAYDDCACALEFGYPKQLQHKLIMRQAHCAWKLGNSEKLGEHVACLEQLQLNAGYSQQLEQLQQQLVKLGSSQPEQQPQELQAEPKKNHKILTESGPQGRHMVATESIDEGAVIFTEQADCFVPITLALICQQCAASLLCAPIPCTQCRQRVVYCSRRCRQLHARTHSYECAAYRRDLLGMVGVSHLAMRLVLTYLPAWLSQLQPQGSSSAPELWHALVSARDAKMPAQALQSLRMITHLDKAPVAELVYHALCANLLQAYLHKCTNFYDQLRSSPSSAEEWHVLVAALILRSAGQLLANGHVGDALLPCSLPAQEFALLQPWLWRGPYHIRLGCLHKFAKVTLISALNLPYLSLCNHSCAPTIRTRYDGCAVSNFAARQIAAGEEIFNCYTLDYKSSTCVQRQAQLEQTFNFTCRCTKCMRLNPDQDHLKFHRYRCERAQCGKSFVPASLPQQSSLSWWLQSQRELSLKCTVCKAPQLLSWFEQFLVLLERCHETRARREAFKSFDKLDTWLLDYHSLKLSLAKELIAACFTAKEDGASFDDNDYDQMARIINLQLAGTAAQFGSTSMEYVSRLSGLWDLLAWGKHKCDAARLAEMRAAVNWLGGEARLVFVNYYNDFIEQLCK